jgi:hypothetical protein
MNSSVHMRRKIWMGLFSETDSDLDFDLDRLKLATWSVQL